MDEPLKENANEYIILEMNDEDDNETKRQLFVDGSILRRISPVFDASISTPKPPIWFVVFGSQWCRGAVKKHVTDVSYDEPVSKRRKLTHENQEWSIPVIKIEEFNFATIRTLVEFAQTGRVNNLRYQVGVGELIHQNQEHAALLLYMAAHKYDIKTLEKRCLNYLRGTCTTSNISDRLSNPGIKCYPDIESCYLDFLIQLSPKIRETQSSIFSREIDLVLKAVEIMRKDNKI